MTKRQRERLIVLLFVGLLALNFPVLALFSKVTFWLGIPLLYLYLFSFWAVFIVLAAAIVEKGRPPGPDIKVTGPDKAG